MWRGANAELVAKYVASLQFPPAAARASGEQLAAFIRKQAGKVRLNLVLGQSDLSRTGQAPAKMYRELGGLSIGSIGRTPESQTKNSFGLKKSNILSPTDEALDFDGQD